MAEASKKGTDVQEDILSVPAPGKRASAKGLSRLLPYLRPQLPLFLFSTLLVLFINGATLVQPYILQVVIDNHLKTGSATTSLTPIIWLAIAYFAAIAVSSGLSVFQSMVVAKLGQNTLMHIRRDVFFHIMHLPMKFLDHYASGRLITRATNDVETLNELFSDVLVNLTRDILLLVGIVGMMLAIDWQLALIAFVTTPLIILVTFMIRKALRRNFIHMKGLIGRINGFFAENIAGMRLVQIFCREKAKRAEFAELNDEYCRSTLLQIKLNSLLRPLMEVINTLGVVALVAYASRGLVGGVLQIGVLYAFTSYIKQFFEPINDLAEKYATIQSAVVSSERIFELLDHQDGQERLHEGEHLTELKGHVEFRHVWFAYEKEDWVLKDVSLTIEPGQSAAIVGATGAGKSTIIALMLRFYDIQKGEILLDGRDIRLFRLRDLRRQIAIVLQEVFLFSGTIADNIRLGDDNIDDDQIAMALKMAYADAFISNLSHQMDTPVTERGSTFSAGQRQLLSFARAIARKPAIFVLDEATANIDTETEQQIQQSIAHITRQCTTIIIAHRLSTIRHCDMIIVLDHGRLVETGNHEQLLARGGRYADLYQAQFGGEAPTAAGR
ncbi:MAG: ABC transporter ATP-binding protein/permease [Clostridiales bacterium]|nr:ABC transporter ATP-binding protein/permease [Clostridiales bacterium]